MDNRKLIASGNAEEIRAEDGNMVVTTDNSLVERTTQEKQELVRELVKRWNAYHELITVLDDLMYELKARDENYDMRETYGRADRLLKSIDPNLGDSND